MNGHPTLHAREERHRALAHLAHHLNQALAHLHAAAHYNLAFGLGLDLPKQEQFLAAMSEAAKLNREPPPAT